MVDTVSKEQRSLNMSLIRSSGTKPEVFVRAVLHRLGFRFRKNVKTLHRQTGHCASEVQHSDFCSRLFLASA